GNGGDHRANLASGLVVGDHALFALEEIAQVLKELLATLVVESSLLQVGNQLTTPLVDGFDGLADSGGVAKGPAAGGAGERLKVRLEILDRLVDVVRGGLERRHRPRANHRPSRSNALRTD